MATKSGGVSVTPYETISLRELTDLIELFGHQCSIMAIGETGIGKSSVLKALAKRKPEHMPAYVDMTTKDFGDLLFPKFIQDNGMDVVSFIPNSEFGLQHNKPLILMWDELSKSQKGVLNQCIRTLQEWQIGEHKLPEGTIQFATGNTSAEGVGDTMQPHQRNRAMIVYVRKPNPEEWTQDWALPNNVHPTVLQAVNEFPMLMMSWTEFGTAGENPYVFDPRKPSESFATPRSLGKVSDFLWVCDDPKTQTKLPYHVQVHAISGLVGKRAAVDIMGVHALYHQLSPWEDIIEHPSDVLVPSSPGAQCLQVYRALGRVKAKEMDALMIYLQRLPKEVQALFATTGMKMASTRAAMLMDNEKFYTWASDNQWLHANNS